LLVKRSPSVNQRTFAAAYDQKKSLPEQCASDDRVPAPGRMFVSAFKQCTERIGVKEERYRRRLQKLRCPLTGRMTFCDAEIAEIKALSEPAPPFSNKVLTIDEDTRVLAIVSLATADAREGTQEITQAVTLYGKNAIVWANGEMVGSFVTPRDDTLSNFVREATNRYAPPAQGALNRQLALAATVYNVLSAHGLRYQVDPNTPFSRITPNKSTTCSSRVRRC
jgi:hypothetical protein